MNEQLDKINRLAAACKCGHHRRLAIDAIWVERDAIARLAPYARERGYRAALIVADANTFAAAGGQVRERLADAGVACTVCLVSPNAQGDVVADEASIVQVMLDVDRDATDVVVAVGSGTVHDIVRFAAYKMGKPFLSVPTAPSVDGFNSAGAPILVRGDKKTIPAGSPVAIFADLRVLVAAPAALAAAGFGDMLGKYTSLFDWHYSHLTAGEPYCAAAEQATRDALASCVEHAAAIASGSEAGIAALMNALIDSGLAMLLIGTSHPASAAEHHLSHYWEMEYLRLGRRQLLHGAKVGVACAEIAGLYRELAANGTLTRLLAAGGATGDAAAAADAGGTPEARIRSRLDDVPPPERIRELLRTVRGPSTPEELGVDGELLQRSLREAHAIRARHTLLRAYNESRS